MNHLITKSLLILLSTQLFGAKEITVQTEKFEDKFCKEFKSKDSEGTFCMTDSITYPVVRSQDKKLERYLTNSIREFIGELKKGKSKKYVLESIKDEVASPSGHQNDLRVDILSVTPKTFTLEISDSSYMGGAHGMFNLKLVNYDRATGKKLKIDDLFIIGFKKKLTQIIEKEYRRQEHVNQTDKLSEKLYWFGDEFMLAENIGIGEDGLYLEYNPYEVKPYAGGTTSLFIRYDLIKDVIAPDSYLSPLIQSSKLSIDNSKKYTFLDKLLTLNLNLQRLKEDEIELTLATINSSDNISKGGVSLSFPQLKNGAEIINKSSKNIDKLLVYPQHSSIYNFQSKKNQESDYLLVEGEAKEWENGGQKSIKLTIKIPKDSKTLKINLRATLVKDGKILQSPFDGVVGQQGIANYFVEIDL